jgi:UDP-hydrolysing UDP-N-acetyl-D-glucosamine 2-epimerase
LPILREILSAPDLALELYVTGMHLAPEYGRTVQVIERDGFPIAERIEMLVASDSPEGIAKSIGLGVIGFSQAFGRKRPDILMLLGDRFEMLAAASAALPFALPLAHVHGGESTEGLIDEAIRHALTKMSHVHFVSTEAYAKRVIQMGEDPSRVTVSGAPGLDNLRFIKLMSLDELADQRGMRLQQPFLLVTYHPLTLETDQSIRQLDELLGVLEDSGMNILFTYPNADTDSRRIIERVESFARTNSRAQVAVNLGTQAYFSVMSHAQAMVGNSSSGIIEAASFKLPVVDIGNRQRGRLVGKNVVHAEANRQAIAEALNAALGLDLENLINPYGDGHAAGRIVKKLQEVELGTPLLLKRFHAVG